MRAISPLAKPAIPIACAELPPLEEVTERLEAIWRSGRVTNGACVEQLEAEAAVYLGVHECVAVSSCTAGLMLVARCLGLRGEVILPSFTFFATGHALLWNRLTPVFADCDPATFDLDPGSTERVCGRRTSAILAVHTFGCPAAVEELQRFARERGLKLIFDGAHAFGARVGERGVAAWGDATVFSLAATKPLVAGEGGLIATSDAELAGRLRQARNYGNDGSYDCAVLGLNARMTEFQAAVALAGLPYVERGIERRRQLAGLYQQYLDDAPALETQKPAGAAHSTWNGLPVWVGPQAAAGRDVIEQALAADGVETRRYYDPPLHRQKLYRDFHEPARERLAVTSRISSGVLSLPLHAALDPEDAGWLARRVAALACGETVASAADRAAHRARAGPTAVCAR